jgi:hypothetical protein
LFKDDAGLTVGIFSSLDNDDEADGGQCPFGVVDTPSNQIRHLEQLARRCDGCGSQSRGCRQRCLADTNVIGNRSGRVSSSATTKQENH